MVSEEMIPKLLWLFILLNMALLYLAAARDSLRKIKNKMKTEKIKINDLTLFILQLLLSIMFFLIGISVLLVRL